MTDNSTSSVEPRCATDDCPNRATFRLEAGGVGAFYCTDCETKISKLFNGRCGCGSGRVIPLPKGPADV